MNVIDLNCDMGEGLDNDALLMPYISSANIACGYHAGDEQTMQQTIELALQHDVAIGAHPGFADKKNFGRTEMNISAEEMYDLVAEQVYLLQKTAAQCGTKLHHVKPHGALYNMGAKDAMVADAICKAVFAIDPSLVFFGLSGSCLISEAKNTGLKTASEVFADRTYQDNGMLTPRSKSNAMIDTTEQALQQVLQMVQQKNTTSTSGKIIPIIAETICLHGDGAHAVSFAKEIYQILQQNNIAIKAV